MDDPVDIIPNRVRGYRLINGQIMNSEYVDISSRFAGGGTRSTVVDLLKYATGIMDKKLLKEETWNMMFTSMATQDGRSTGYGMGWGVRPWRGHFQVSHGGSQPETRTRLLIFPKERFAVAIASNLERLNLMPYVRRLAELVLEEDLDSTVYISDEPGQIIYDCCAGIYSYGMSRYDWHGKDIFAGEKELAKAFSYFNRHVKKNVIEKNIKDAKKNIDNGFHPLSGQVFIKVGAFMASTLKENLGEDKFHSYHKSDTLFFFKDYIEISSQWPSDKNKLKFSEGFSELIFGWVKEWSRVYPESVRNLCITIKTDFMEWIPRLTETFSGASLYPDFSREMGESGLYHLWNDETEISFQIFNFCYALYPRSPAAASHLATAHLWTGNIEDARKYFKEAFALDPEHPSVSLGHFSLIASHVERSKKIEDVFTLAGIALELYPKSAELHLEIGNMYSKTGNLEKARSFYKKALELDPKLEEAKENLEELKKKK
jgi:tetratricopeptide (TPR) repeat protein